MPAIIDINALEILDLRMKNQFIFDDLEEILVKLKSVIRGCEGIDNVRM
jgi:hypothetical protein